MAVSRKRLSIISATGRTIAAATITPLDILDLENPVPPDSKFIDFLEVVITNNASCIFCISRVLPPVGAEQRVLFPIACELAATVCPL